MEKKDIKINSINFPTKADFKTINSGVSEIYGYKFGIMAKGLDYYVIGFQNELEEDNIEHGIAFENVNKEWTLLWSTEFSIFSTVYSKKVEQIFLIGSNGDVEVTSKDEAWDEIIDSSENGPSSLRNINGACVIGEHVYVVGMRRQVYRRVLESRSWDRFDDGCFVQNATTEIFGLNAIHGLTESEIYAVGFRGEIWCYNNSKWNQIESPAEINLYSVCKLNKGDVIVGGGLGILLRGNSNGFYSINHNITEYSITSIVEFYNKIFITDENGGLFELIEDKLIVISDFSVSDSGGGHLNANNEALIYTCTNFVLIFDGTNWTNISPPDEC